jgi:hypothetical protein
MATVFDHRVQQRHLHEVLSGLHAPGWEQRLQPPLGRTMCAVLARAP